MNKNTLMYPMEVRCAWCDRYMHTSKCHLPGKVSHGICEPCNTDLMAEVERYKKTMEVVNKC